MSTPQIGRVLMIGVYLPMPCLGCICGISMGKALRAFPACSPPLARAEASLRA